jgi:hypothetical protein
VTGVTLRTSSKKAKGLAWIRAPTPLLRHHLTNVESLFEAFISLLGLTDGRQPTTTLITTDLPAA